MSERLDKIFKSPTPKTKLVSYFVGCYPNPEISLELIKQAIDNGATVEASCADNKGKTQRKVKGLYPFKLNHMIASTKLD